MVLRRVEVTAGARLKVRDGTAGMKGEDGADATEAKKAAAGSCYDTSDALGGSWAASSTCGSRRGSGGQASLPSAANGAAGIPVKNGASGGVGEWAVAGGEPGTEAPTVVRPWD